MFRPRRRANVRLRATRLSRCAKRRSRLSAPPSLHILRVGIVSPPRRPPALARALFRPDRYPAARRPHVRPSYGLTKRKGRLAPAEVLRVLLRRNVITFQQSKQRLSIEARAAVSVLCSAW
jgi:hypothetical protein